MNAVMAYPYKVGPHTTVVWHPGKITTAITMDDIQSIIERGECAYWEMEDPDLLYFGSYLSTHIFSFAWLPDVFFLTGPTSSTTRAEVYSLAFDLPSTNLQHYSYDTSST